MRVGSACAARARTGALAGVLATYCSFVPEVSLAHPFPAEPPSFDSDACIEVVDKREQGIWHLDYRVPFEDTVTDPDKVALPDTKTHQFLAISGTMRADAMGHAFLPFGADEPRPMPTWLTLDDVQRADAAVDVDLVEWNAAMLTDSDVAENDPELWNRILPFTNEPRRVPITEQQGTQGVDWDLADVPAGVYQIVAYIFSPPHNGWAPRAGLLKLVDGGPGPAVVTLRPVGANLFAGQGRRITGCVDAPEGSTVEIAVRNRGDVNGTFETWLDEQPVEEGEYDVCLQNPGMDGTLEVRVQVHTPSGESAFVLAEEVIAMFASSAPCVKSDSRCCPPEKNDTGAGAGDAGAPPEAGRDADAGRETDEQPPGSLEQDAGSDASGTRRSSAKVSDDGNSGCGVSTGRVPPGGVGLVLLAVLGLALGRRAML